MKRFLKNIDFNNPIARSICGIEVNLKQLFMLIVMAAYTFLMCSAISDVGDNLFFAPAWYIFFLAIALAFTFLCLDIITTILRRRYYTPLAGITWSLRKLWRRLRKPQQNP